MTQKNAGDAEKAESDAEKAELVTQKRQKSRISEDSLAASSAKVHFSPFH